MVVVHIFFARSSKKVHERLLKVRDLVHTCRSHTR